MSARPNEHAGTGGAGDEHRGDVGSEGHGIGAPVLVRSEHQAAQIEQDEGRVGEDVDPAVTRGVGLISTSSRDCSRTSQ
jgi:hypothetical protein